MFRPPFKHYLSLIIELLKITRLIVEIVKLFVK